MHKIVYAEFWPKLTIKYLGLETEDIIVWCANMLV